MESKEKSKQNLSASEQQGLVFQTPEMQAILKLKQKYEKSVQQSVHIIENLAHNKLPQKCLQHNNNFTLYCEQDQKPLCASCMYQNHTHKSHKILPLANCTNQIKRDCDKYQKQLSFIVENMTGLVKHLNSGISNLEKQFPQMVWKIEQHYKTLHQFLIDRQKQHVNELRYYKEKMKYQHGALSAQLNKISMFTQQKIDQYSRKTDPQILLTKRSIYDSLKNSTKIISDQLNIKDEEQPKLHFQVFNQIEQFMYAKLSYFFSKEASNKLLKTLNNKQSNKKFSKSKQKSSISPVSKSKKQNQLLSSHKQINKSASKSNSKSNKAITPQKQNQINSSSNIHKLSNERNKITKTPPYQKSRSPSKDKLSHQKSRNGIKYPKLQGAIVKSSNSKNK